MGLGGGREGAGSGARSRVTDEAKFWVGCGAGRRKRKSSRSCFSEWILLLSSGECAGIPQILLWKNVVTPSGSTRTKKMHTHKRMRVWGTEMFALCLHCSAFNAGNQIVHMSKDSSASRTFQNKKTLWESGLCDVTGAYHRSVDRPPAGYYWLLQNMWKLKRNVKIWDLHGQKPLWRSSCINLYGWGMVTIQNFYFYLLRQSTVDDSWTKMTKENDQAKNQGGARERGREWERGRERERGRATIKLL